MKHRNYVITISPRDKSSFFKSKIRITIASKKKRIVSLFHQGETANLPPSFTSGRSVVEIGLASDYEIGGRKYRTRPVTRPVKFAWTDTSRVGEGWH